MDNTEMKELGTTCMCEGYMDTSVEAIMTPNDDIKKFVYDDQLLIIHDGKTYNVMGVEMGE